MMLAFDATCARAVVKNTFIHIERLSEDFNERCQSNRRKSDVVGIHHSAQAELVLDIDFRTEASTRPSSAAPEIELGSAPSFAAIRPIVKNTFLHIETMEENSFDNAKFMGRSHRRLSDLLHARNADAESYKLEKDTPISPVSESLPDMCRSGSESSFVCSSVSSGIDTDCSTSEGGNAFVPQESEGSAGHSQGLCRPCVWFWRPTSCSKGSSCEYCHMCDEGAVARAVASKKAMKKQKAKTVARW